MNMWRSALTALLLFITFNCFSQKNLSLPSSEFEKQILQPGIQLLDVRTSGEYASGHIRNSLQANWLNREEFKERTQYLDKTKPVYVYCGSGVRSRDAAKWLIENGFQQVSELEDGFINWKKNNKPVETISPVKQMTMADYHRSLDSSSILLIDFGAEWCPPCKKMEPVLKQLENELNGAIRIIRIDAGIHTNVMQQLRVDKLPTFIIYKNGKESWRKEGLVSPEELKASLR
jgi:rhodanese-related sulfurtransferase